MRALKQLISFPLLCCFLLNVVGYHIVFCFQQAEIKGENEKIINRGANSNERQFIFSLNDNENLQRLSWKGDDEFSFNGQMYDIVEKKIEDGKIIIRCIADKKETALVNTLNDNWNENEKCNKIANELFQFLQTLFHSSKSEGLAFNEPTKYEFHSLLERLEFQIKKIPTPPPQPVNFHFNPTGVGSF